MAVELPLAFKTLEAEVEKFCEGIARMGEAIEDMMIANAREFLRIDSPYPKTISGFMSYMNEDGGEWMEEGVRRALSKVNMIGADGTLLGPRE